MPVSEHVPGVAVYPGQPHTLHIAQIDLPSLSPDDVLVRVIQVGVCGTDREIIEGHIGQPPSGSRELVIGHEVLGIVEQVGGTVHELTPGDFVTATARRGCECAECRNGTSDFCSALAYKERGIVGLHGYWTTHFVESASELVQIPAALAPIGVLVEPLSVPEKVWRVALSARTGIPGWKPRTAAVFGAGPIGLLATLMLRAKGLDVFTFDLKPTPNGNQSIVERAGASYVCTLDRSISDLKAAIPSVDLIVECTGSSAPLGDAMHLLGNNGVLVLLSVTGGATQRTIPADQLNFEFVLGNKLMCGSVNSSLADFRAAVADLERIESRWPGLAASLITHRLPGLESALDLPGNIGGAIKAVIEVSAV